MKVLLFCSLFLALPLAAHAWELEIPENPQIEALPPNVSLSPLLTVTSDRDAGVYSLGLMRDAGGAPLGLSMAEKNAPATKATPYLFHDIASANGVVLLEASARKVLLLQGALNTKGPQSRFHLRYLSNGLFMTYDTCDVLLVNQGGAWFMRNAYSGAKVTAVKVLTSTFGVDTLQGICPAQ